MPVMWHMSIRTLKGAQVKQLTVKKNPAALFFRRILGFLAIQPNVKLWFLVYGPNPFGSSISQMTFWRYSETINQTNETQITDAIFQ